jgi:ketosteroid isomerase-like protein
MGTQENVQTVKDFFAAMGGGEKQRLLALAAEDIEWIIPGEDWPLAGTHRGHAGLADLLQKASKEVETSFPEPPEFVAQGHRVFWSSASLLVKSKPRISHSRTSGSSTLPFETAR